MASPADDDRALIRENADLFVGTMREELGVELGLDAESVRWLDGYIERNRGALEPAAREKFVSVLGSFLGEAIIAEYGGEWVEQDGGWAVHVTDNVTAFPFAKVAKHLESGAGDSVHAFFAAIPALIEHARRQRESEGSGGDGGSGRPGVD